MTTTEYLDARLIRNARKLTEKERATICKWLLTAYDYESEIRGPINGSRFVDLDAKALGIAIDWRYHG